MEAKRHELRLRETLQATRQWGRPRWGIKGALRMDMCVRVRRGLVVAGLLLGGVIALALRPACGFCCAARKPARARLRLSSKAIAASKRRPSAPISRSRPASVSTPPRSTAALKALYASGLFQDIHISQQGGRLIVTVVEAPVIDRLAFEGNNKIKDEQLQQEIQSKARGTLSRADGAGRRPAHHRGLSSQRPI